MHSAQNHPKQLQDEIFSIRTVCSYFLWRFWALMALRFSRMTPWRLVNETSDFILKMSILWGETMLNDPRLFSMAPGRHTLPWWMRDERVMKLHHHFIIPSQACVRPFWSLCRIRTLARDVLESSKNFETIRDIMYRPILEEFGICLALKSNWKINLVSWDARMF